MSLFGSFSAGWENYEAIYHDALKCSTTEVKLNPRKNSIAYPGEESMAVTFVTRNEPIRLLSEHPLDKSSKIILYRSFKSGSLNYKNLRKLGTLLLNLDGAKKISIGLIEEEIFLTSNTFLSNLLNYGLKKYSV